MVGISYLVETFSVDLPLKILSISYHAAALFLLLALAHSFHSSARGKPPEKAVLLVCVTVAAFCALVAGYLFWQKEQYKVFYLVCVAAAPCFQCASLWLNAPQKQEGRQARSNIRIKARFFTAVSAISFLLFLATSAALATSYWKTERTVTTSFLSNMTPLERVSRAFYKIGSVWAYDRVDKEKLRGRSIFGSFARGRIGVCRVVTIHTNQTFFDDGDHDPNNNESDEENESAYRTHLRLYTEPYEEYKKSIEVDPPRGGMARRLGFGAGTGGGDDKKTLARFDYYWMHMPIAPLVALSAQLPFFWLLGRWRRRDASIAAETSGTEGAKPEI